MILCVYNRLSESPDAAVLVDPSQSLYVIRNLRS